MPQPANVSADRQHRYRCPACNEPMTYGSSRCDSCNEEAPIYNRRGFWPGLWTCLGLAGLAVVALIFV